MTQKQPALLFYTGDWLKDPAVSSCSPTTRGVWIDLLCAMHESGRTGQLRGSREQLARIARCQISELIIALAELQTTKAAGVIERNGYVTLTNRRMEREHNERKGNLLRQSRFRANSVHNGFVTDMITPPPEDEDENEKQKGEGVSGKGISVVEYLRDLISARYKRPDSQRWTYEEECTLCQVARRPGVIGELHLILKMHGNYPEQEKKFLPGSVSALLRSWPDQLDRARNYKPPRPPSGNL